MPTHFAFEVERVVPNALPGAANDRIPEAATKVGPYKGAVLVVRTRGLRLSF